MQPIRVELDELLSWFSSKSFEKIENDFKYVDLVKAIEYLFGTGTLVPVNKKDETLVPCTLFEKVSFPQKAKEILGWEAKHNLEDMCKSSWNWQSKNPKGYGK